MDRLSSQQRLVPFVDIRLPLQEILPRCLVCHLMGLFWKELKSEKEKSVCALYFI